MPEAATYKASLYAAAWCALLLSFFLVPRSTFNNVSSAVSSVEKNDGYEVLSERYPVLASRIEGADDEADNQQWAIVSGMRERVAANMLIRSGYLIDASRGSYSANASATQCALNGVFPRRLSENEWNDEDDVAVLLKEEAATIAIVLVAAEKFNRTVIHRILEGAYARVLHAVTGSMPDLSFGPAQMRISLARMLAEQRPKDAERLLRSASPLDSEILVALQTECTALSLAALHIHETMRRFTGGAEHEVCGVPPDATAVEGIACARRAAAVRAYVGGRRAEAAPLSYTPIVVNAASSLLLRNEVTVLYIRLREPDSASTAPPPAAEQQPEEAEPGAAGTISVPQSRPTWQ